MADIFISYSREDEIRIKMLVNALEEHGWSVFWDRRIPAGETWRSYIGKSLDEARCIIVAWSKHSIESQWVAEEADDGRKRQILLPILLEAVKPPHGFRELQAADLSDWKAGHPSEHFEEFIQDLERCLGKRPQTRQDEQHHAQHSVVDREDKTSVEYKTVFSPRVLAIIVICLLVVSAVGYWLFTKNDLNKTGPPLSPSRNEIVNNTRQPKDAGQWLIIAASVRNPEDAGLERKFAELTEAGFEATLIETNNYPLLAPNLWVVAIGPFDSIEKANRVLSRVKVKIPDAYVKKGR